MTQPLDDLEWARPVDDPTRPERPPAKCPHPRRARVAATVGPDFSPVTVCGRCQHVFDPEKIRRGRSSRRLGHDGERRSERRYGLEKIGERGQITDLRGKAFKVQQKTSRGEAPVTWRGIFAALEAVADGRTPAILLSYVKQGVAADDFFVIRGSEWLALFGNGSEGEAP